MPSVWLVVQRPLISLQIDLAAVGSKTFDCLPGVSPEVTLFLRIQLISWFTVDPVLMRGSSWIG
jgi:hypothetical protein